MKNSNTKKVNGIGKACSIISMICFVICVIAFVLASIGFVGVLLVPMDKIHISGNTDASLTLAIDDINIGGSTLRLTGDQNIFRLEGEEDGISISDDEINFNGLWSLDVEKVDSDDTSSTFRISGNFEDFDKAAAKRRIVIEVIGALIDIIAAAVTFFFAHRLFKELAKCETPFTEDITKKTKVFGWILIGYCVICGADLSFIVLGLAVLMLAYVFAHGAQLQKESDETI